MFQNSEAKLNFTCDYELRYKGKISFGWSCITPVMSYLQDLAGQLSITNRNDLPSCDSVCSEVGDRQLSYDDFVATNITTLESFCKSQSHCSFNISVDFDFVEKTWVRRDGSSINDLKWASNYFPRYQDVIVNHLYGIRPAANWIGSSRHYRNLTGFYFCTGDQVENHNLKLGSYFEAKSRCSRIMTLKVCNNRSLSDKLITMIKTKSTESSNDILQKAVYDFDFMLKPLRLWTGIQRLDQTRFIDENGTIITSPHCPINQEELCDGCPIGQKSLESRKEEKS